MIAKLRKFITTNSVLLVIVACSSFLRLYNLKPSLMFQGDQGRDAILVAQIFKDANPVFIGPVTSVGNMYLGPLYYYFMVPFLMATYPSPVGPAVGVAVLGVLTSALMFKLGSEMVGKKAAIVGSFLYTFSATAILYNRFSWNPNPAPLIGFLLAYFTWKSFKKPIFWWLVGLFAAIIIQLHYMTLLGVAAAGVCWLYQLVNQIRAKSLKPEFLKGTILAIIIFILSLTPLMLFDSKHNWLNTTAFASLFKSGNFSNTTVTAPTAKLWTYLKETDGRSQHIFAEHAVGHNRSINRIIVLIVIFSLFALMRSNYKTKNKTALYILFVFALVGVLGTSVYQHTVFDHYIAYLFPIVFLIHGNWLAKLLDRTVGKVIVCGVCGSFLIINIPHLPIKTAGWTVDDIAHTSRTIADRVGNNEKYNIVLISESKDYDGQNYRYFLTTYQDKKPVLTEHRAEADTLFIIDEIKKTPDVTTLPVYEIVTFPNKNIAEKYQVPNGPIITILRR